MPGILAEAPARADLIWVQLVERASRKGFEAFLVLEMVSKLSAHAPQMSIAVAGNIASRVQIGAEPCKHDRGGIEEPSL